MATPPPRERILASAGGLFHRRGYGAVTVDEVLTAAGLSRAEFHRHFASKSELGLAWLCRLERHMEQTQTAYLERLGSRERRLRKYFNTMQAWLADKGYRGCPFANTAAGIDPVEEPEMAARIDHFKRRQRQFFIDQAAGLVGPEHAARTGTAVFLLYSGAMTEAQNLHAAWPLEDACAVAEQLCGLGGSSHSAG